MDCFKSNGWGQGWDHAMGMSKNAIEALADGAMPISLAARRCGVNVAWLHGAGVYGKRHHVTGPSGKIQSAEFVTLDQCMIAITNNLRGWGMNSRGLHSTCLVMEWLAECV